MTQDHSDKIRELAQELFQQDEGVKQLLEALVESAMQAEVEEHLGAGRYERSAERRGRRNGSKPRTFNTRSGELHFQVPQVRECEPYHPSLFARWQRSERALLVACAEMYFQGVSTRKVQAVLAKMCGFELSAMTVSRIAAEVDAKLDAVRERRLTGEYPYLMIDARYEKVRSGGPVSGEAVLVVVGFNEQGQREILDWRNGDSESMETWGSMFRGLKQRGLEGVKLVISDAHGGIRAALAKHFQGVKWQRCRVHFKREIGRKVANKQYREVQRDLAAVFGGEDRQACLRLRDEMADKWEKAKPKVAAMLRDGLEDCLTVLEFPASHGKRLTSTNMVERLMKTIKQRTQVVGVFPNRASCERLVRALLVETHEHWQLAERAYFNMENFEEEIVAAHA